MSNTVGVAGFPSGEAYKIGADAPYLRLPRAFLRQTIALGDAAGAGEPVEGGANQFAGSRAASSLTLTVGKSPFRLDAHRAEDRAIAAGG